MSTKKALAPAIKISIVFFMIALALQFSHNLIQTNWDFSSLTIDEFTLMVPVLVFAWELITSTSTTEINTLVKNLPGLVREGTQEEINTLKVDNEEFRRQIAKGVVEHNQHYYRTLIYKNEEGSLFNGYGDAKDTSRNVLFSNKTINLIFRYIKENNPGNEKLLHNLGKSASERFAAEMVRDIERKFPSSQSDLTDWLSQWIEFDSDAGFGKFALENKEKWHEEKVILLKYSFLTEEYSEGNRKSSDLCGFMSGYLEGIINSFPHQVLKKYDLIPKEILVTHDVASYDDCICAMRPESEGCRYHVKSNNPILN